MVDTNLAAPAGTVDGFSIGGSHAARALRPEQRLADDLARPHSVPVPIEQLISGRADLISIEMPPDLDVDAILLGLDGTLRRPRVVLNARRSEMEGRRRFTLAHELAHIVLVWHVGTIGCSTAPGAGLEGEWTSQLETEANRFAARLLVPQHWLQDEVVVSPSPEAMFQTLARAQVSALPALLRLVPELPYGWMIALEDTQSLQPRIWRSPGSFMPPVDTTTTPLESRNADRRGVVVLAGRRVRWWNWVPEQPPYPDLPPLTGRHTRSVADVRRDHLREAATTFLRAALAKHDLGEDQLPHFAGVSGAVNESVQVRTAPAIDCALRQRFSDPLEHGNVVGEPEFRNYLAARAWQWSETPVQAP